MGSLERRHRTERATLSYVAFAFVAVGLVDLLRRFVPARALWVTLAGCAAVLVIFGALAAAPVAAIIGVVVAALWFWLHPIDGAPRLAFWPAIALALFAAIGVIATPARASAGVFGDSMLLGPLGEMPFDLLVLGAGVGLVMLETGNEIVRTALRSERLPVDEPTDAESLGAESLDAELLDTKQADAEATNASHDEQATFRGGRLIGPLERVIVLMLTLAVAYPLLAAMLAAKGIVRFPEISRDRGSGARAEYFLVGSLVSWVVALGGAFLLWWAAAVTGLR